MRCRCWPSSALQREEEPNLHGKMGLAWCSKGKTWPELQAGMKSTCQVYTIRAAFKMESAPSGPDKICEKATYSAGCAQK